MVAPLPLQRLLAVAALQLPQLRHPVLPTNQRRTNSAHSRRHSHPDLQPLLAQLEVELADSTTMEAAEVLEIMEVVLCKYHVNGLAKVGNVLIF